MNPNHPDSPSTALVSWFREHQRDLPWRRDYAPYGIWVSEMMLQQTQVATVLPYYNRWMKRLPDVKSLAEASEEVVLKLWEGLGYYSRARNLHKAAHKILQEYGGAIPTTVEELIKLPGIGRYTAGAIASIAFNQEEPVVDGNVIRVLCRVHAWKDDPTTKTMQQQLWQTARAWIPSGQARHLNQAMMELGATVCHVHQPTCQLCPLHPHCEAGQRGLTESIPLKKQRRKTIKQSRLVIILKQKDKVLVCKRPETGLWAGLWEFPNVLLEENQAPQEQLERLVLEIWQLHPLNLESTPSLVHSFTHHRETLFPFVVELAPDSPIQGFEELEWKRLEELKELTLQSGYKKIITLIF